jgi:hypothetical protein
MKTKTKAAPDRATSRCNLCDGRWYHDSEHGRDECIACDGAGRCDPRIDEARARADYAAGAL